MSEGERENGDDNGAEAPAAPARSRAGVIGEGQDPAEMGRRSAAARRRKREERIARVADSKLTVRQRIGLAMAEELSVEEWKGVIRSLVKSGKPADVQALARLADQAYGRARESAAGDEVDDDVLTREEAATMLAELRERMRPAGDESDPRGEGSIRPEHEEQAEE